MALEKLGRRRPERSGDMGVYANRVLPRMIDLACGTGAIHRQRVQVAEGLSGTVVEIGFGSGLNLPAYPSEVETVLAVEPAGRARTLAQKRMAESPIEVRHVGLDGQKIPLDDASCDGAMCTFTLCTIPDASAALAELRRVVKPGGRFHFLEHGLSPEASVAKWQYRLDPIEKRVAGGCHLTREPLRLIADAGFEIETSESAYIKGPKPWSWLTKGTAINT